jgi:large subunit ribosomal protein L15
VGFLRNLGDGVKVLGRGDIDKAIKVKANAFSKTAAEKIAAAGGTTEVI